jgi:hypothetical protein
MKGSWFTLSNRAVQYIEMRSLCISGVILYIECSFNIDGPQRVERFLSFTGGYNSKEICFSSFPVNDFRLYAQILNRKKFPIHTVFEMMGHVLY